MNEIYEAMIVFDSRTIESEIDKMIEKVKTITETSGGEILKSEKQGRKKFAYEIKGRKEGNFVYLEIRLNKNSVPELERNCRLSDSVLRYSIFRKSKNEEKQEVKK